MIGGFYGRSPEKEVSFGGGQFDRGAGKLKVLRDQAEQAPRAQVTEADASYRVYRVRPGDSACIDDTCVRLEADGLLAARIATDATVWTTRTATISTWQILARRPLPLVSSDTAQVIAVDATDPRAMEVVHFGTNREAEVRLAMRPVNSRAKAIYLAVFSLLVSSIALVTFLRRRSIYGAIVAAPYFTAGVLGILSLYYFIFYPGLFFSDLVVGSSNAGSFTAWYSSMYMIYMYIIYYIGVPNIQLPTFCMLAFMLLYINDRCSTLDTSSPRPLRIYLLSTAALNPFLFILLLVGQRYITAPVFLLLGMALSFGGMRRVAETPDPWEWREFWTGQMIVLIGALMRPEYTLILATQLLVILSLAARSHKLRLARLLAVPILVYASAHVLVNRVIPSLHDSDSRESAALYNLTILLELARPYVGCPGPTEEHIKSAIDSAGGVDDYCAAPDASSFYWQRAQHISNEQALIARDNLIEGLSIVIPSDPVPTIQRFFNMVVGTWRDSFWVVSDQYQFRDELNSAHAAFADMMGLVIDRGELGIFNRAAEQLFAAISKPVNYLVVVAFVLVTFVFPILFRNSITMLLINLSVMAVAVAAIFLSPVPNWAYVIVVPLWASFAYPFFCLERASGLAPAAARMGRRSRHETRDVGYITSPITSSPSAGGRS